MNSSRRPKVELARLLMGTESSPHDADRKVQAGTGESMSMIFTKRKVVVVRVPETARGRAAQLFLREIEKCVDTGRPRIVLDCSNLRHFDRPAAQLLVRCLEEAMKRNGDVKLAALPVGAEAILELTGLGRLFEAYGTVIEAENSFHELPTFTAQPEVMEMRSPRESESAA